MLATSLHATPRSALGRSQFTYSDIAKPTYRGHSAERIIMRNGTLTAPTLVLSLLTVIVVPAYAQEERPSRPYRGLFGGGQGEAPDAPSLAVQSSVYGAYDDNILTDAGSAGFADPRFQVRGSYLGLTSGFSYSKQRGRVSLAAGADTSLRYYQGLAELTAVNHQAGIDLSFPLGQRTRFRTSQNAGYSPYYQLDPFPGATSPNIGSIGTNTLDHAIYTRESFIYNTLTELSHSLSSSSSISFSHGFQYADFSSRDLDLKTQTLGGHFSRSITKDASLRLGYFYQEAGYTHADQHRPIRNHSVDAGADYRKRLSISRRTTFAFSLGSALLVNEQDKFYRLLGNANLSREFSRTWRARLTYARTVEFVEGFHEPFFPDNIAVDLSGAFNRRLDFRSTVKYSTGEIGFVSGGNGYDMYVGSARLRFDVTTLLAIYGEYLYYRYDFGERVQLLRGMAREVDRQGGRVGLMVWLPLLH